MALTCPKCQKRVSLLASKCGNCGTAVGLYTRCVRCRRIVLKFMTITKVLAVPSQAGREMKSYCRKCQ